MNARACTPQARAFLPHPGASCRNPALRQNLPSNALYTAFVQDEHRQDAKRKGTVDDMLERTMRRLAAGRGAGLWAAALQLGAGLAGFVLAQLGIN